MEYSIHETNTGRLIGILIRQFDVNLPNTSRKRCCWTSHLLAATSIAQQITMIHTVGRTVETNIEFLHVIIDECDFIVAH